MCVDFLILLHDFFFFIISCTSKSDTFVICCVCVCVCSVLVYATLWHKPKHFDIVVPGLRSPRGKKYIKIENDVYLKV